MCFNFQECFNPFIDIDTVPEKPKHIPPYNSRNQSSLGDLLLGFLKYYAMNFRYVPSLSLVFRNPHTVLLLACFSCSHFLSPRPLANFFLPHQFSFLSSFYPASFSGFMFVAEGHEQVVPLALYSTKVTHHDVCVLLCLSLICQKCRMI